jgi:hypothetical protein
MKLRSSNSVCKSTKTTLTQSAPKNITALTQRLQHIFIENKMNYKLLHRIAHFFLNKCWIEKKSSFILVKAKLLRSFSSLSVLTIADDCK